MKRLLALLLCLAMMLSFVPATLFSVSADTSTTPEDTDIEIPITPDDEIDEPPVTQAPSTEETESDERIAPCAACGADVAWIPVATGECISSVNGTHFYLTEDCNFTAVMPVLSVVAGDTVCLDLNAYKLTTATEITVKGVLNIQGEGYVCGNIGSAFGNGNKPDVDFDDLINAGQGNVATYDAALINIAAADAVVNIYGGTYSCGSDKPLVAYTAAGSLNLLGGEIAGNLNAGNLTLGGAAKVTLIEAAKLTVKADWTGAAVVAEAALVGGVAEGDFTGSLTTPEGKKVVNNNGVLTVEVPVVQTGITVTAPTKVEYELGEELALEGMTVTAVYSNGTTAPITEGFTVSGFDSETAGAKTVTVTYGDFTATFEVTVKEAPVVVMTGIAVTTQPSKVTYMAGETFDAKGMVVTATYSDGSTAPITEYTVAADLATAGTKTVTVTCGEFTATFTVEVLANVDMTISVENAATGIVLNWTAPGADKFQVYQSTLTDGAWSDWTALSTGTTSKTYTYKSAVVGTQYKFKVVALSSDVVIGEIVAGPIARVTTPTAAVANVLNGVQLTWTAVDGAEAYYIYRNERIDAATNTYGEWVKIGETTESTYIDETAVNGGRYSYMVRTLSGGSLSAELKPAEGKRILRIEAVEVTTENTVSGIRIKWTENEASPKFYVYRSVGTVKNGSVTWGAYSRMVTIENANMYSDLTAKSGYLYRYAIRGINNTQQSCDSNPSEIMRLAVCSATASNQAAGIEVKWAAVAGATAYNLYRSEEANGSWTPWGKPILVTTDLSYMDASAVNGVKYRYMTRPVNTQFGDYISGAKTGAILHRLDTLVVTTEIVASGIKINWVPNSAATKYFVYKSQYVDGAWTAWERFVTVNKSTSTYTHTGLDNGAVMRYMLRVNKGEDQSQPKATGEIIYIKTPTVKAAATTNGIKLTWGTTAAPNFDILRRTYDSATGTYSDWELLTNTTAYEYVDTTAQKGVYYQYTLHAINGTNVSPDKPCANVKW